MKTTDVFSNNLDAYINKAKIIANKGSSRSSKTWSVLQLLYLIALNSPKPLLISIVSRTLPHLKAGSIRDFDNILMGEGVIPDKIKNKTDNYYRIGLSIVEFFGADQIDKVHGPSRDILFINEAPFIKYNIFDQLATRTSSTIFIDYNPTQRYWLQEEVELNEPVIIIHSTYQNNQYIPKGVKERLDHKLARYNKEKANGTLTKAFENYCKVYLFGEEGVLEGAIYENWRYEQPGEIDKAFTELSTCYGLDYGFYPDPDAMAKIAIDSKRRKIYIKEKIYTTNNGTADLISQIKAFYQKDELIIAESASPRTNYDLQQHFNLRRVSKTKTVVDWIREMQDLEWIVEKSSFNTANELQNYVWSDRKSGTPIDAFNHILDLARYVYMTNNMPQGSSILGIETF